MAGIKVPIYEEQIKTVTPQIETPKAPTKVVPGVVRGAFGENVYEAQQSIAQAGQKIAGVLLQMEQDRQDTEVLKRETAFRQDYQLRLSDTSTETVTDKNGNEIERPRGFLNRELGQAKGVTQEADDYYYKQLREQYAKGLSKYQLAKLAPAMDNYHTSIRGNLIVHEAREHDKYFEQETKSNLDQKILDASLIRTSDQLVVAIDDGIQTAAPFYRKFGPATQKVLNEKIAEGIAKSAVIATIERSGDYQTAKLMLDGIKDKIPDSVYNTINDEIGKRAVVLAIANDMSLRQEDSDVMKELQKGKSGMFGYLAETERVKAIKESQQRIFYNSQIAKRDIEELQKVRNDAILDKFLNRTIILADIENEKLVPEEQGRIKKSTLLTYQKIIQNGIKDNLSQMLREKNDDKEPTKRARMVKQYLDAINTNLDTETEKWDAREKLATSYADGVLDANEAVYFNKLKNDPNSPMAIMGKIAIKGLETALKGYNASIEDIGLHMKQLIGLLSKGTVVPPDAVKKIIQHYIQDKLPETTTLGESGGLFKDYNGTVFKATEEGIEPATQTPEKEKSASRKYMESTQK